MSDTPIKDLCLRRAAELKCGPDYRRWTRINAAVSTALVAAMVAGASLCAHAADGTLYVAGGCLLVASFAALFGWLNARMINYPPGFPAPINEPAITWLVDQLAQLPSDSLSAPSRFALERIEEAIQSGRAVLLSDAAALESICMAAHCVTRMERRRRDSFGAREQ